MGSVVLSVDAELGWGFHDLPSPPADRIEGARAGWRRLARLLERFEVPATWAVVGHLALDSCDGVHAEHPVGPDWFARETGSWADRPDLRFAPELVDDLVASPVGHEIGCHSFSHVVHTAVRPAVVRAEVSRAREALARRGVAPTSYVFPRNAVAHGEVLATAGFTAYRSAGPTRSATTRRLRKVAGAIGRSPPLVAPRVDRHGLVELPPSLFLFGFEGPARAAISPVLGDPIVRQARRGVDRAASGDGVLHLWLHPNDLTSQSAVDRLERILRYVRDRVADSPLEVETMRDVAARTIGRGPGRQPNPVGHA